MLAFAHCQPLVSFPQPPFATSFSSVRNPITRIRASMNPVSTPSVSGFPYLPPAHRDLMSDLISSIEARLGPTLLPSAVPADLLYFENPQGNAQGAVDIRSGDQDSLVDSLLESWIHCKVPNGDLNITTIFAVLNTSTDAPHLMMDFIQGGPASLILFIDLLPRKDLVLHPEYLDEFYSSTNLDKLRQDIEKLPQVSLNRSSSLYLRSILSPTAIAVSVNCGEKGESCMEDIMEDHISKIAKEIVGVWMDKCASRRKDLEEVVRDGLVKRDELVKNKIVEIDLAPNLPRLFGADVAGRVVGEIQKAFRITKS